jgi:purine-nucleoside phosphorylase
MVRRYSGPVTSDDISAAIPDPGTASSSAILDTSAAQALTSSPAPPEALAAQAAAAFAQVSGVDRHEIALVLGSGWAEGAQQIGPVTAAVAAETIPGFAASSIPGHAGQLCSVQVAGTEAHALVIAARSHYYERRDVHSVAHPIRMAAHAGARILVLTNGCGAIRPWAPGTVAVIRDHLNLTGATPLVGAEFVDLTDLYTTRLRAVVHRLFPQLPDAVYAQFPGPQYETPAEVKAAGILGADLVGMSTALEAIAARAAGLDTVGLSLVTNPAAGTGSAELSHGEVLQVGRDAADRLASMIATLVPALLAA